MLTFEEWRHTYADVFETDDAARAAWTAASNKGYSAGVQDTRELLVAHSAGAQGQAVGEWVLVKRERLAEIKRYANAEFVNSYCGLNLYDERSLMENERIGEHALSDIRDELRGIEEDEEDEKDRTAVHPQPMPQTDAARELIEAAKDVLANGHQHDVGGGDVFLGTCDSTERLQRALAEIERLDRAKGE